jgi:hypothetical protein
MDHVDSVRRDIALVWIERLEDVDLIALCSKH